jgi:hypothetical protein
MNYEVLKGDFRKEFPELLDFEKKFSLAYDTATNIVGEQNMERIKEIIRENLNNELQKYLARKPKNRFGKFVRFIVNLVKKKK